ncbi:MAG: radical SAM protein [Candidatus Omnitrophica bacterium]|jgi:anaerobic magnesium-protoporphyrin IX monomethyl ester cyclase|nr:B12-binding domain-containing radical SAM protein [Candidatus Omnitrophota bacterium]MDD5080201.1 radical SAM protein [Candidatus Omnitrophota bacterium]
MPHLKKILLVRPPRYLWPVVNESDNYMMPLGLACLASMIQRNMPEVEVKIIDCPPLKIGWKSLADILRREAPDVVGAGEEALYHHEAVRLFTLAKQLNPQVVTVAGGHFFSWTVRDSLARYPIDYIVRFEGEATFLELMRVLRDDTGVDKVQGIAYKKGADIILNPLRPLIQNLDEFPIPAYGLMPMGDYSPFGYFWPQGATIEHGRGCVDKCSFCSLWTFWGEQKQADAESGVFNPVPRYRTKSVGRVLEEIDLLYNKYKRKYLIWADPTFNVDPHWTGEFCDGLIQRGYKDLFWWAFIRADLLVRDEKMGVLKKMVCAGLINAFIGLERADNRDLNAVDKNYNIEVCQEAFRILKEKYPSVHRQGTLLTGIRQEKKRSIFAMVDYALDAGVEFMILHPITPVPGTFVYQEAQAKGWIAEKDFSKYDWLQPVMSIENMSLKELGKWTKMASLKFLLSRWFEAIRGLLSPYIHRRRLYLWFMKIFIVGMLDDIKDTLMNRKKTKRFNRFLTMHKPAWYDD